MIGYLNKFFIPVTFILCLLSSCTQKKSMNSFQAMDTFMTMQAYGKNSDKALRQAENRIIEIEKMISTTVSDSSIYKINQRQETSDLEQNYTLTPESSELLTFSFEMAHKTKGAFNPCLYPVTKAWGFTTGNYKVPEKSDISQLLKFTDYEKVEFTSSSENSTYSMKLPPKMQLDLGAVGKGYAGDQVIELLRQNGITSALLDLGGNVQVLGNKPDGGDWAIGIKNPWDGTVALGVKVSDKAVITSGGYERFFEADDGQKYIHIIDGNTGLPVNNDIASVTIIADKGIYADALSTALFVMGTEKAISYWKENGSKPQEEFQFVITTKDKKLLITPGVDRILQESSTFVDTLIIN